MRLMEEGGPDLDSFHFGGCNTVADSLYLSLPTLCLGQGNKWYNRIGPAMLKRCNLPELITTTEPEFIETALRLIHDDNFRQSLRTRLTQTNLNEAIFTPTTPPTFSQQSIT